MDKDAVWHSQDMDLMDLRLRLKGDIVTLKAFCCSSNHADNKKALALIFKRTGKECTTTNHDKKAPMRRLQRKISSGWMNYDSNRGNYIPVRRSKGSKPFPVMLTGK